MPCLATLPAGWDLGGVEVEDGQGTFWLDSDLGGDRAVEATLLPRDECRVEGASEVPSDEAGLRRYERIRATPARPAQHALLPVSRRVRHLRVRLRRPGERVVDLRRRQRARVPASRARWWRACASRATCGSAAPGHPRAPADRDRDLMLAASVFEVVLGVRRRDRGRGAHDRVRACVSSASGAAGSPRWCRGDRLGSRRARRARASPTGTGAPTA